MKINIVTGFFLPVPPVRGGSTEKIWHRLAVEFAHAGHELTFVSRAWPGFAARETVDGVSHLRLPGADHTNSLVRNLWRDVRWGARVTRALPPADVTICNTVTLPIWLRRIRPAAGHVVAVIARMPKGHGRFYGGVDQLLSLSPAVTEAITRENPRLASRVVPFPYPIDWGRHAAAGTSRPSREVTTIGYVGRIHPEKGVHLLLRAAVLLATERDLPRCRVLIVGPTDVKSGGGGEAYLNLLEREAAPIRDRVVFAGPEFDPVRLVQAYADIDVFCYPSVAEKGETFGVAVAEAMATACVPVVSALPCFAELVRPGDTGLVFDHRAADAPARLAAELAKLLRQPDAREQIARRASASVRRFDYREVSSAVLQHLERLAASGSRKPLAASQLRD